tara:strand:+ start:5324 stop:5806 length:483 start_codon:yes stop_codon:yes gene_type:complete
MQLNLTELDLGLKSKPNPQYAALQLETHLYSWTQLQDKLPLFRGDAAWVMYTDETQIQPKTIDTNKRILQAEVYRPAQKQSMHVRHHHGDTYQLQTISQEHQLDAPYFYVDQKVLLPKRMNEQQAYYRCWYHMVTEGDRAYRWQPYLQQFLGYEQQGGAL